MIDGIIQFIHQNAYLAHWFIFGGIILAAFHFPISTDLLMIIGATLAATIVPENVWPLFFAIYFGCIISAWLSYWIGRLLGPKLLRFRFFARILKPERIEKLKNFYGKYGLYTLILGRFIPFGARNCIFMSTGISKSSFSKFALRDALAAGIWSITCFSLIYFLGKNFEVLYHHFKMVSAIILSALSVTGITLFWYRKRKKSSTPNV
ncbi:MAG TPA: DedA family protein [Rhabdochlamydiaceae bacterium]|nr:DedA family protein [Rhabdochlamydiaceae bacterium]